MKKCFKVVTLACVLTIWLIKLYVRPHFSFSQPIAFLLGIAPNLLDSFLLPFAATWLTPLAFTFKLFGTSMPGFFLNLRFTCLLTFFLLLVLEYCQLLSFARHTFDYWDITASAAGAILAYYSISVLQQKPAMSYDLQ